MVRVLFIHPDLGIGGAERLVVDAALALQSNGHTVSFLTNHHDTTHCFEETRNGTLFVETVGDFLPRSIFGRFYAFCAYLRMVYAAVYVVVNLSRREKFDIVFCDQISLGVPILKLAWYRPKILFYCHFPDLLLSRPGSIFKSLYRFPLNFLEEKTTGLADRVLVNSKFTSRVFKETFKRLDTIPEVLYPSLNTKYFDNTVPTEKEVIKELPNGAYVFLSINRYERKKNLALALMAFNLLETTLTRMEWDRVVLVIAGGYDKRVLENVEHFDELSELALELNVSSKVIFLRSPHDKLKLWLLQRCQSLIYTPENEHFGIVPLEGMYVGKPVIACNSGGPTETVVHDQTGFLCEPSEESFAAAMTKLVKNEKLGERMGVMGHKRVQQRFSFEAFSDKLEGIINGMMEDKKLN